MTTQEDLRQWFIEGKRQGATHMIIVCDTFDHEDYPVYVKKDEDVHDKETAYSGKNMQRVMEVYNLRMDREKQLGEHRAFNY